MADSRIKSLEGYYWSDCRWDMLGVKVFKEIMDGIVYRRQKWLNEDC